MNHYNEVKELLHAKYFRFAGETGVDAAGLFCVDSEKVLAATKRGS